MIVKCNHNDDEDRAARKKNALLFFKKKYDQKGWLQTGEGKKSHLSE